jgi:hypothetical protein
MKNWQPLVLGPEFCRAVSETRKGSVTTYRHAQQTRGVVLQLEVLVGEAARSVDGGGPRAVAIEKVSALDHEVLDLAKNQPSIPFQQ